MKSKKVLFITPIDIQNNYGSGGEKASRRNYELVREYFGNENTYLLILFKNGNENQNSEHFFYFQRLRYPLEQLVAAVFGCKEYLPWKEKRIVKLIRDLDIDLLFIDTSLIGRLARYRSRYKTIVFYHNVEADYTRAKIRSEGWIYLPAYWASKRNDCLGLKADLVMGFNRRDSMRLKELYGRGEDFLMPVTFGDRFKEEHALGDYERKLLFVGSLFFANIEGIEWFMKEVFSKLDNISLDIVGKGFEVKKEEYERISGVHVIGSVESLDEYYYNHAAIVMPIFSGSGMKVKTAEAMMFGRVIFASDEALEGYDVEECRDIYRCNSAEEYISSINSYFNRGKLEKYSKEVRNVFLNKYETNRVKKDFFLQVDNLLGI